MHSHRVDYTWSIVDILTNGLSTGDYSVAVMASTCVMQVVVIEVVDRMLIVCVEHGQMYSTYRKGRATGTQSHRCTSPHHFHRTTQEAAGCHRCHLPASDLSYCLRIQPIKTHFMILLNYSKSLEQKLKKQSQRNWCRTELLLNREKSNLLFFTVLQ